MPIINPTVRLYAAPVKPKPPTFRESLPGLVTLGAIVGVLGYLAYRDEQEDRTRPKVRGIETKEDFERYMNT